MHATLEKFGYPQSLLREFNHCCILLRPQQVTLGALVLCSKHQATSLGTLPAEAHAELAKITEAIEKALGKFRPYDKINYLALMMVDPHVHVHVLPRYATPQVFDEQVFNDAGWPSLPDLKIVNTLNPETLSKLLSSLLDAFLQID